MKKTLILLIALFICFSLYTTDSYAQKRGYEKSISVGISPSTTHNDIDIKALFTNGYRFNKHIFLGGGIGIILKFIEKDTRITTASGTKFLSEGSYFGAPIFITSKFNFTKSKFSPYFSPELGYMIGSSADNDLDITGFFASFSVGADLKFSKNWSKAIFWQIGYSIKENKNELNVDGENSSFQAVELRFGFKF